MLGQAVILAWAISTFYKIFTGRPAPELSIFGNSTSTDISHVFKFGILKGGIFWGWPSSHTTVAFAAASAITWLYQQNKKVLPAAWIAALYIGFGAGISFHWFSDFLSGAIIGTIIGSTVGKSVLLNNSSLKT